MSSTIQLWMCRSVAQSNALLNVIALMHFNRGLKIRQPAAEEWGFLASTTSIIKNHVSPTSIPANDQYIIAIIAMCVIGRHFTLEDKIIFAGVFELKFFYLKTEKQ